VKRKLESADLIELLDLEERKQLAQQLKIEEPANFKDQEFLMGFPRSHSQRC